MQWAAGAAAAAGTASEAGGACEAGDRQREIQRICSIPNLLFHGFAPIQTDFTAILGAFLRCRYTQPICSFVCPPPCGSTAGTQFFNANNVPLASNKKTQRQLELRDLISRGGKVALAGRVSHEATTTLPPAH